jgi:hypothetical protein
VKIFNGKTEIELATPTEILLWAALKAIILSKGEKGMMKGVVREIRLPRFSFQDAARSQGQIQIHEDGNNGSDVVGIIK